MILVTGSTGLVGAHLLYKLVIANEKVRAIYRNDNKLKNVKSVFSCYTEDVESVFKKIDWVKADILDVPALTEAFKNIDYAYHCAAFVSFEPDKYHLLRRTNIEGTANIVNICLANNVKKLCYVSSVATLGKELNNKPITEDTNWNPDEDNNVYAITKYGAEMEVWRATQEGLDVVIVNPGVILGGGIWTDGSGSLFKRAYKGLKFYTSGKLGLVAVEDVVSIMVTLLKSDIKNERFLLVAENWSYKNFLQGLAISVNTKPPKKLAASWLLNLVWKLDWLKHKITGKQRKLTRHIARSLQTEGFYSSEKIKSRLNYNFKSIDSTITAVGLHYLKQVE
ncbi:NAD-dependent epimerase/dehydratase family protein [uncultured Algibacter sp.]|uniref:NAD-dependent epimerase/dehydratase family protein n=1 Tax=uncultured Algibacter sp. TaxID=298659 RepID=UPI00260C7472|nr:NAD-dependent epimerase/dehydratase family protein [uncultured Algibacter sp.]